MNNIKDVIEDIKVQIDAEQVKNRITTDLGLKLKNDKCLCFIHGESNPSMSFDKRKKKFKCFSCGSSYDIFTHYQEHYGLSFLEGARTIIKDFSLNIYLEENKTVRKANKKPTEFKNEISFGVMEYINKRKISKATLDKVGNVKCDGKGNIVFQYKNENGELVANKFRPARKIKKEDKTPKMWFEKGTNINTLFNMENVDFTKELNIIEGEFDCLSLVECGETNTVSIPSGVNGFAEWIQANYDFLEQFPSIKIWFDNDEAGIKGAREASNRLPNIVKIVTQDIGNDANEILFKHGKEKVLEALKMATTQLIDGVVTLDMVEDFDVYEAPKLKTGIKNIDDAILGILYGSLNIFTGRNGAGKSTILNQIYIGESIRQGQKPFLFSGELAAGNIKYWLLQTLANESDYVEATSKDGHKYKKIRSTKDLVNKVADRFYLYDSDDYKIDSIIEKMDMLAKRNGVKVFILDNLMMIFDEEKDEYKAKANIVTKLKNFAKKYNAIVHLVAHPKKSMNEEIGKDDVAGRADITNLADYVTTIERNFKEDRTFDAKLSIVKNRPTGINTSQELVFDRDRKRFYSSSEKLELGVDYLAVDQEFIQVECEGWEF